MASPYADLESRAFWRSAVGERDALDPGDLYRPRFPLPITARVATAGSCFAQHVGRALRQAGYNVQDAEPFPVGWTTPNAARYGFGIYSARYGNIYTVRQLLQLHDEAFGALTPALPVWERGGRFFDAQRPGVEPDGLDSPEAVLAHRARHLARVRALFQGCDVFVFTLGLTEAWVHTETGTVYPTAPGTIAGTFDPAVFSFVNYGFPEILADFETFMSRMKAHNPDIRFLVTTSPVPLTATATGQHVEVATAYSKAVLRAVCGTLYERHGDLDYFPSYEVITSANNRGVYFASNKRSVSDLGVQTAMRLFLTAHGATPGAGDAVAARGGKRRRARPEAPATAEDVVCEEALLEAFSK
ncbi:MAG: GSCFA domain-containing protein [Rhodobacteraceae bacterium]|nr:GSCFA domain-containing protein [Paracoccaceae bacterium]